MHSTESVADLDTYPWKPLVTWMLYGAGMIYLVESNGDYEVLVYDHTFPPGRRIHQLILAANYIEAYDYAQARYALWLRSENTRVVNKNPPKIYEKRAT